MAEALSERQEDILRRCLRLEVRRLRGELAAEEEEWGTDQKALGPTHEALRAALGAAPAAHCAETRL
jgi:hypothetical protein